MLVIGRMHRRNNLLLGRCTSCGGHISAFDGQCLECGGIEYCDCHDCFQIASLHQMLQNDLFWLVRFSKRKLIKECLDKGYSLAKTRLFVRNAAEQVEREIESKTAQIIEYRSLPPCGHVQALEFERECQPVFYQQDLFAAISDGKAVCHA